MINYKTGDFDIDHPILCCILFGMGILLFLTVCTFLQNDCYKGNKIFEYEDLDGNKGTSYECQYSDKGSRSGGQGQPICFVEKKTIAVKWYEDKTEYGNCAKIIFEESKGK